MGPSLVSADYHGFLVHTLITQPDNLPRLVGLYPPIIVGMQPQLLRETTLIFDLWGPALTLTGATIS